MSGESMDHNFLQNILGQSAFWMVNKQLARVVGLHAALMLSDLISKRQYFAARGEAPDGWFFQTVADIEEQTTLTKYQQAEAKKILKQAGLVDFEMRKVVTGERQYFFVNDSNVVSLLAETDQPGVVKKPARGWLKNCTENKNKEKENKSKSNTITREFFGKEDAGSITSKCFLKVDVDSITKDELADDPLYHGTSRASGVHLPSSARGSYAELEETDFAFDGSPRARTVINTPEEAASFFDQATVRDAVYEIMLADFDSTVIAHKPEFAVSRAVNVFCSRNSVFVASGSPARSRAISQLLKYYAGGKLFKRMEDRRQSTRPRRK